MEKKIICKYLRFLKKIKTVIISWYFFLSIVCTVYQQFQISYFSDKCLGAQSEMTYV